MDRRLLLGWISLGLGAAIALAGVAHSVAITATAFEERGGLDGKWAGLLSLGVSLVAGGTTLAAGGWRLLRGTTAAARRHGALACAIGAGVVAVHALIAAPFFSPVPVLVYAGYLVAWWWLGKPLLASSG